MLWYRQFPIQLSLTSSRRVDSRCSGIMTLGEIDSMQGKRMISAGKFRTYWTNQRADALETRPALRPIATDVSGRPLKDTLSN